MQSPQKSMERIPSIAMDFGSRSYEQMILGTQIRSEPKL